jgi:hypothetical protein
LALHALLVALVAFWCGMEIINFGYLGGWLFGHRWSFLPNSCVLALFMAIPGFVLAYRRRSIWRVALYVPLVAWWTILQPTAARYGVNPTYFIGAVGALLLVIAESHARGSYMAIPFRAYGTLLFGGALVLLSYFDFNFHRDFWAAHSSNVILSMTAATLLLATIVFGLAEWLRYRYLERGRLDLAERMDDLRRRQWLPLIMVVLIAALPLWELIGTDSPRRSSEGAWIPTLSANVAMVALALWLMWVGLREDRGVPFAAGVLYFLLWMVIRYIDLFGEMGGMLGAALLFFVCGCLLLGVVGFWRYRKQVHHV